jgi:hypothetical protein
MNPLRWYRRRRVLRFVKTLDYQDAAYLARVLARSRSERDRRLALALCDQALATMPDGTPGEEIALRKYRDALVAGRRIKTATFPAYFTTVPVPEELVADIESAFQEGDTQ